MARESNRQPPSSPARSKAGKTWHSVCVEIKAGSCEAARELLRKKFLSREAPGLPLPTCSNRGKCPCVYKHYEDRRTKPRRSAELGGISRSSRLATERRGSGGRRATDGGSR